MTEKNQTKKILLVDDDSLIIRMYQTKLTKDGYEILLAFNGEEAIIKAKKDKPDLILLDLMMPKMNGVETLEQLKKDSTTKNIPVVILTNLEDKKDDVEKAKKMGALGYWVKAEIDLKNLSSKVKEILSHL